MSLPPKRDGSLERWLSVALRTAHLAGVVWVGAAVLAGQPVDPRATALMAASSINSHAPKGWRHGPVIKRVR